MTDTENEVISFFINGEPEGKGRPRFRTIAGHVSVTTPEKTASYENLIRLEYQRQCKGFRFADDDMLTLEILAVYRIPKSDSKKTQQAKENGAIRPTKKPDMDNVCKVVADALNGYAYRDDTQIVDTVIRKYYGQVPFVKVVLYKSVENALAERFVAYIKGIAETKKGMQK